jgi:hypothetical protein
MRLYRETSTRLSEKISLNNAQLLDATIEDKTSTPNSGSIKFEITLLLIAYQERDIHSRVFGNGEWIRGFGGGREEETTAGFGVRKRVAQSGSSTENWFYFGPKERSIPHPKRCGYPYFFGRLPFFPPKDQNLGISTSIPNQTTITSVPKYNPF